MRIVLILIYACLATQVRADITEADGKSLARLSGPKVAENFGFAYAAMNICDLRGFKIHPELEAGYNVIKNTRYLDYLTDEAYVAWVEGRNRFYQLNQDKGSAVSCVVAQELKIIVK